MIRHFTLRAVPGEKVVLLWPCLPNGSGANAWFLVRHRERLPYRRSVTAKANMSRGKHLVGTPSCEWSKRKICWSDCAPKYDILGFKINYQQLYQKILHLGRPSCPPPTYDILGFKITYQQLYQKFLVMWPGRLSALNPPMLNCVVPPVGYRPQKWGMPSPPHSPVAPPTA